MNNIKFFKKSILFEDNHLIIINKKPGELTQGDKTKDKTLGDKVKEYIKKKLQIKFLFMKNLVQMYLK